MKTIDIKERKKYISALRKNFIFADVDEYIKKLITEDENAEWINFSKDEIIYGYDNYKRSLGIILRGKISVRKDRTANVLLNTLKAGEVFGGAALFSGTEGFIATLKAECSCDIVFLPEELMERIIAKSPVAAMNYIRYLSDSLTFLNRRLDIFTAGGAEKRTLEYIRRNSRTDEFGKKVADGMNMTSLAEYLAIGRATLYRILDDFENRGIVERYGRKIYIKEEI